MSRTLWHQEQNMICKWINYISQYESLILYCYILAYINLTYFNQNQQFCFPLANISVTYSYVKFYCYPHIKNIKLYIPLWMDFGTWNKDELFCEWKCCWFFFFMSAWWRNILGHIATVKIAFIFISSSAIHIMIFIYSQSLIRRSWVQILYRPYFHYCVSSVHHVEITFIFKETSQPHSGAYHIIVNYHRFNKTHLAYTLL